MLWEFATFTYTMCIATILFAYNVFNHQIVLLHHILIVIYSKQTFSFSGARSVKRDLESQVAIFTNNEQLQETFRKEQEHLYSLGTPFSLDTAALPDRKPALWILAFICFFKSYF